MLIFNTSLPKAIKKKIKMMYYKIERRFNFPFILLVYMSLFSRVIG